MKLETRDAILKELEKNYALIRDEDWEVLCLLWRDDNWYYALYMEHYNLSKEDAIWILDKAAGVALLPVVDNEVEGLYKKSLKEWEKKMKEQVKQIEE